MRYRYRGTFATSVFNGVKLEYLLNQYDFMKKIFLVISIVALSFFSTKANNMLFPQYEEGVAILQGGVRVMTQFNYDKVEQRMQFIDSDGRPLVLDPSNVVVVIIGDRTFVPANNNDAFNERVSIANNVFYVRHRAKESRGIANIYGTILETRRINITRGVDQAAASTSPIELSMYHRANPLNVLLLDESVVLIRNRDSEFIDSEFVVINSLRRLTRQFSSQRTQIENFARRNNTNFRNVDDVKAITMYALSL